MLIALILGLLKSVYATFGKSGLLGNMPNTLFSGFTDNLADMESFVPKFYNDLSLDE
jgi:hypothetical protein